jgi:anti-sigma factor RsiW
MDEYLQKYLDGDLSDAEAEIFSRALSQDPALEAELRTYERMLAEADAIDRNPGPEFTDRVMERVEHIAAAMAPSAPDRSSLWRRTWMMRTAMAAGLAAVFLAGYLVPRPSPERAGPGTALQATAAAPTAMRLARLVYVPADTDVDEVTVAGTFNGWNPEQTTMTRRGNAWVVEILLPPQTYEYMFVENGQRWVTDPLALQTRDDGFGRKNAVLDLEI